MYVCMNVFMYVSIYVCMYVVGMYLRKFVYICIDSQQQRANTIGSESSVPISAQLGSQHSANEALTAQLALQPLAQQCPVEL